MPHKRSEYPARNPSQAPIAPLDACNPADNPLSHRGCQHFAVGSILRDMGVPRSSFFLGSAILAVTLFPKLAQADEIRLKDGQKLYGVIVSYEDNMFKVKTDFGFVLVEKNKIASIVPNVTSARNAAKGEPSAAA